MKVSSLIIKSFLHYFRKNLSIALGIALSTAVITGALIVGDSMRYSLHQAANYRLGNVTHTITSGESIFTSNLATEITAETGYPASSVLLVNGNASLSGGKTTIKNIKIWGIDDSFSQTIGSKQNFNNLENNEVIISENISKNYKLKIGDSFLLKIMKVGPIPANTPFSSDDDNIISKRVKIKSIATKEDYGRIDLNVSQTAPNNVFVPKKWLNKSLELEGKANLILISSEIESTNRIQSAFLKSYNLEDLNLNLESIHNTDLQELTSGQIFINNEISSKLNTLEPQNILSYFVNSISNKKRSCPYSFISALDTTIAENEIIINDWLAKDLGSELGDTIELEYFKIGPLKELETFTQAFILKEIVEINGQYADTSLMPSFPGMTDAGNCRDWETDIPIDLSVIRDKDEKYWDDYNGIPKAFININKAAELWSNRFGTYTSLRFSSSHTKVLEQEIRNSLNPFNLNFIISEVKKDGEFAAKNGTDFSQLFIGLSFFIILSAIILSILLFKYNLSTRATQIGTLIALGYSRRDLIKIYLSESLITTISGVILGSIIAIFYNQIVLSLLSGYWNDIVRTSILEAEIKTSTVIIGGLISLIITTISLWLTIRKYFKKEVYNLQRDHDSKIENRRFIIIKQIFAWLTLIIGVGIIISFIISDSQFGLASFFISGTSLLISGLLFSDLILFNGPVNNQSNISLRSLGFLNIYRNKKSGLRVIILLTLGTFIVISTGSNKKNLSPTLNDRSSGTGEYLYIAETNVPILVDLEDNNVLINNGIEGVKGITQFRVQNGDNASCLNLNRISQPRIIATDPSKLFERFSFVSKSNLINEDSPWESLNLNLDGVVPAIADQTVIQWGLGKKVGDTLTYTDQKGNDLKLLLIAGLGASVFQGNVIISEENFNKHFPSSSGSNFFLVEGNINDTTLIQKGITRAFRDNGIELELSYERLSRFKSVENTYLTIFLLLGILGLLIGTIGLAIVLVRNINERKSELALFISLGFSKSSIFKLLVFEYAFLLVPGTIIGSIAALIAVIPALLNSEVSFKFLIILITLIIIHGIIWIVIVSIYQLSKISPVKELRDE